MIMVLMVMVVVMVMVVMIQVMIAPLISGFEMQLSCGRASDYVAIAMVAVSDVAIIIVLMMVVVNCYIGNSDGVGDGNTSCGCDDG